MKAVDLFLAAGGVLSMPGCDKTQHELVEPITVRHKGTGVSHQIQHYTSDETGREVVSLHADGCALDPEDFEITSPPLE